MNGRALYEMYRETQADLNNCSVDTWDQIDGSEQNVWIVMADNIKNPH